MVIAYLLINKLVFITLIKEYKLDKIFDIVNDEKNYLIRRILYGIPDDSELLSEVYLPFESNMDLINASKLILFLVDFKKGCYLGQVNMFFN